MGQRINIQYSVEIDDLADEVGRLMNEAHSHYIGLWEIQEQTIGLTNETLEKVDQIRQELAAVDHRLNDVVNIISGYLYYKAQGYQPSESVSNEGGAPPSSLQTQIEEFKSLVKDNGHEVAVKGK